MFDLAAVAVTKPTTAAAGTSLLSSGSYRLGNLVTLITSRRRLSFCASLAVLSRPFPSQQQLRKQQPSKHHHSSTTIRMMAGIAGNGKGSATDVLHLTAILPPKATPSTRALLPLSKPVTSSSGTSSSFGGSATLVVLDAGGELKNHSTPHEALIVCLQGTAKVLLRLTEGAEFLSFTLNPGDALPMPAGAPHSVRASETEPLKFVLVKSRNLAADP